jgi:hypothetical protein
MNIESYDSSSQRPGSKGRPRGSGWPGSLLLGLVLVVVYLMNGRELGTDDTASASLLPLCILRGDGIYFDNRILGNVRLDRELPPFLTMSHRRVVTLYPIAPALVVVPLVAPQVAVLDLVRPGWDRDRWLGVTGSTLMTKRSMAVVVALAGVVLHR